MLVERCGAVVLEVIAGDVLMRRVCALDFWCHWALADKAIKELDFFFTGRWWLCCHSHGGPHVRDVPVCQAEPRKIQVRCALCLSMPARACESVRIRMQKHWCAGK